MSVRGPSLDAICALAVGRAVEPLGPEAAAAFLQLATAHGMTALLAESAAAAHALPAATMAALREQRRRAVTVEMLRQSESELLFDRFTAANVPVLVMKGTALATTHYAHPALRPRCDTDLLVSPARIADAGAVLREAGYDEELTSGGQVMRSQETWCRTDRFGIRHTVDLHRHVSNRPRYGRALAFDELWSRSEPFAGREIVRALCAPDALLLASVHLAGHHDDFERLIWFYDVHLLVSRFAPGTLELTMRRAGEKGVANIVEDVVARTAAYFGAGEGVPAGRRPAARPWAVLCDDLRCTRGGRRKLQLLREHLLPPTTYMLKKYNVRSRGLLPALYLRRVVAGVARAIRAAAV